MIIPRLAIVFCAALLLSACNGISPNLYPEALEFQPDPRLEQSSQLPAVGLTLLNTGENSGPEFFLVGGGGWFTSRQIAYSAVWVHHPKGDLLIDSGLGPEIEEQFAQEMHGFLRMFFGFENPHDVHSQLTAAGFDAQRIEHILLTHPHWDHAGGIESFADAQIWHPTAGTEEAWDHAPNESAYFASQLDGPNIQWHDFEYISGPYENFQQSLDFYGDGSIVLVPMGGHTQTSFGVFVNLADGQRFLFSGDATWLREGFELPAHKSRLASWIVDGDRSTMELPIVQVHHLMKRYPGLTVLPAHDWAAQNQIGFFPQWVGQSPFSR